MWDYFAVSAKVIFKEPTYRVIRSRRIDPINNSFKLIVKEVTPANYEGIITGKIRLLKGGDYASGFYPDGFIGELQNGYGRFLRSFDPTGEHRIQIIGPQADASAHAHVAPRDQAEHHQEFRSLKSEIDDNFGEEVIVGEF